MLNLVCDYCFARTAVGPGSISDNSMSAATTTATTSVYGTCLSDSVLVAAITAAPYTAKNNFKTGVSPSAPAT